MAVTTSGSVYRITADNDTIPGNVNVCGILYIAGTGSPSIVVRGENASDGMILWETASTTPVFNEVSFKASKGLYIDLAGTGTVLYIYTQVR